MRRALVVTASNRAAAGVYEDRGGPIIVEALQSLGFHVDGPEVVPDGDPVAAALRAAVAVDYDLVVTTGGTGLTPGDLTPEVTRSIIDREIPGIAEAIRAYGAGKGVDTAVLSRGVAGLAAQTLIVNLPGSTGGVRDGMHVLGPVLAHAIDQVRGGDHPASDGDLAASDDDGPASEDGDHPASNGDGPASEHVDHSASDDGAGEPVDPPAAANDLPSGGRH